MIADTSLYVGKAEVAEMLGLTLADFTKGLFVLDRLGFPQANATSPGDPRWLRGAVEAWRAAHWDKSDNHRAGTTQATKSGRQRRSPEQTAMMHIARQV